MSDNKRNKVQLPVGGMSCDSCAINVRNALAELPGIVGAEVSYASGTAIVDFLPHEIDYDEIKRAIEAAGYGVESEESFQTIQTKGGGRWVQAFIEAIDVDKCNGCGKCVRACGQNVYTLVEIEGRKKAAIVNGDECLGDCHCHKACPNQALICRPRRSSAS